MVRWLFILFGGLWCMNMLVYTSVFLRSFRPQMYQQQWKGIILPDVKARIIELGIKKVPIHQPYRRTRGRRKLFQPIRIGTASRKRECPRIPTSGDRKLPKRSELVNMSVV